MDDVIWQLYYLRDAWEFLLLGDLGEALWFVKLTMYANMGLFLVIALDALKHGEYSTARRFFWGAMVHKFFDIRFELKCRGYI